VAVFAKDRAEHGYAVTDAVVRNLARVMLIKDEPFVAALLTSPEKYKRDRRRYNVNPARGDKIIYHHLNKPELELFGRTFRLPAMTTRDWQLRIMARMRFLRRVLFRHKREHAFRDWYESLVDRLDYKDGRDYQRWLAILSTPDQVTGYREVRYPKMEAARRRAEQLLKTDPAEFEPPTRTAPPTPAAPAAPVGDVADPAVPHIHITDAARLSLPVLSSRQ
jgi:indolepyruvate ferredoxin oxidoreductase